MGGLNFEGSRIISRSSLKKRRGVEMRRGPYAKADELNEALLAAMTFEQQYSVRRTQLQMPC